ncbi:MAG: DNA translocase FtsK, partial [Lentisphaeria bacterium]|nr:DNA translocase FtsK [Lentisphaeria bacterium]
LPPISMLAQGNEVKGENSHAIERSREILQRTLEDFNIPGKVTGYISGPRVTRFEITLAPGVNVKKVEQIQDNITMNLEAKSVRVLAPIPGRPVVGIEVSNSTPEAVHMRSVMESDAWKNTRMDIPLAVGKDVSGKPVVFDLAKAPHLLIAGTTGTGKSVCTNSLIVSLLFTFAPDDLKLIMVDPKVVEFEDYKRLPHLLTPIINDSGKVPIALRWAVSEMERRYRQLAAAGVKKLSEYNSRPKSDTVICTDDGQPIPDRLPYLVIIIDELADLMMTEAKKDAETSIVRIAQKGRAAGIHLILATQRPSTNIITGVIKGNLPSRFCFQVRSQIDSRVVLDSMGAEKLLGMGDMLLMSPTSMNIERVQGAFVQDKDIKSIVKFVSDQVPQNFNDTVLVEATDDDGDNSDQVTPFDEDDVFDDMDRANIAPTINKYLQPGDDDLYKRALEIVVLDRKVSTSYLQRRLKIGYNTAATLTQKLEDRGIIGPDSGSGKKRDILIFDGMEINQS